MLKIARLFSTTAKLAPNQRMFQAFLGGQNVQSDTLRNKLNMELDKFRDNRVRSEEMKGLIEDITEVCFKSGDYQIMERGHFQDFLRHPNLTSALRYLLRTEFFMANNQFVGNEEVIYAIEVARKKFDRAPLLEVIKYHDQFMTRVVGKKPNIFQNEEDFFQYLKVLRRDDSADLISLCYHVYHLNTHNIMSHKVQEIFVEELANIRWTHQRQDSQQLKYQQNLIGQLVTQKIKLYSNEKIRLFTVDLLLSSQTYPDLLKTASLYLLLLNRLESNLSEFQDLMQGLQQILGQDKFNFYFLKHFSDALSDKTRQDLYLKGLEQFQKNPSKEVTPQTQLDQHYQKGNQIIVEHQFSDYAEPVFYHLKHKQSTKTSDLEKYLILRNDLPGLRVLVAERFGLPLTDNVIDEAKRKIQNETILHETTNPFRVTNAQEVNRQNKQKQFGGGGQSRNRTPKNYFSSSKETQEETKESFGLGFLSYLKKNKQIDQGEEIATPFSQIKSAVNKQEGGQVKSQAPQEVKTVFTPIRTKFFEKPITMSQQKLITDDDDVQVASLDNQNRKLEAQVKIRGALKTSNPIQSLQTLFSGYKQDDELLPYLIQVLLEINRNEQKNLLDKLFMNPPKNMARNVPEADLKVVIDSQDGTLEKDYFKYIGQFTVFPYTLGQEVYDELLRGMSENQGFSYRKFNFKKIIAHIALFSTQLHETTFKLICGIIKDQKSPLTLLEGITLLVQRNVILGQNQMGEVVHLLRRFRVYAEESDKLYAQAFKQYKWNLDNKTFSLHLTSLVEDQETERHLNFYELIKDAQLEDIKKLAKQKQVEVREQYRSFALGYVDILLTKELYEIARKVLEDIKASKVPLNRTFHAMWIQSQAFDSISARKYFEEFTEKNPEEIDEEIITRLCTVVQKNSAKLKEFFGSVISAHVFSGRMKLTPEFINVMTQTFFSIKDTQSFANFSKLCADRNLTISYETKKIWVRFMKSTNDDNIKAEIRQSLDRIQVIDDNPRKQKQQQLIQEEKFNLQQQEQGKMQQSPDGQSIVPSSVESNNSRDYPTVSVLDPKQSRIKQKKGRLARYTEFVQITEEANNSKATPAKK